MSDTERLIEEAGRLCEHATPGPWTASSTGIKAHDGAHTVVYALDGYDVESSDAAFIARARTLVPDLVTALRAERERADKATLEALELKQRGRSLELVSADAIRERDELAAGLRSANALYETCKIDRDEYAAANLAANKRIVELEHERDEARSKLSRLTTPRPIAEAPRDGKRSLLHWEHQDTWEVGYGGREGFYDKCGRLLHSSENPPTHFLPLPVEGGQRAEKVQP